MKKIICVILIFILTVPFIANATETANIYPFDYAFEAFWYTDATIMDTKLPAKSAVLVEASTGKILFEQDKDERLPIASVTKIMSTLLVMEAIDDGRIKLEDMVVVGNEAAEMGGSQVYLEPGESMSVHEMLKALVVVSANDATVALAEHISGSEESFVAQMNQRAAELGMINTSFKNSHGLNEEGHYSTAYDVALMTRELLKHEKIFDYTTIWMDTIRNGEFGLANTNKLIRFYHGANGMKTGFTDLAKYCLSATAKRDDMQLIAVVLGSDTSDERFAAAKKLLDFGFANYKIIIPEALTLEPAQVKSGLNKTVTAEYTAPSILTKKGNNNKITSKVNFETDLTAPIQKGDAIGEVEYYDGEILLTKTPVYAAADNPKITFGDLFSKILKNIIGS